MSRNMSFTKMNKLEKKQQKDSGKGFKHSHICHHLLNPYVSVWFCILPLMIVKLVFFKITIEKLTNPKSKSKVQVQVWADDWVFIKIRFSNQPPGHPATQPATRESFKEAR